MADARGRPGEEAGRRVGYGLALVTAAGHCAIAVIDVISAEESSTQGEVAFTRALIAEGKDGLLEWTAVSAERAELAGGTVPDSDERVPVLPCI